jgi:hypothetical protein
VYEQDILKKGQYEYNSFDEVLVWVNKYKERYGVKSMDYFLSINNVGAAELMQDLVKSEIGIRRLEEDYPQLRETYSGRFPKFHQGRFLGWSVSGDYDPARKGLCCYEL